MNYKIGDTVYFIENDENIKHVIHEGKIISAFTLDASIVDNEIPNIYYFIEYFEIGSMESEETLMHVDDGDNYSEAKWTYTKYPKIVELCNEYICETFHDAYQRSVNNYKKNKKNKTR
jgi:hypothetical protein